VVGRMIRYLDDHLVMGLGLAETDELLDKMLAMMARLEIPVKASKTILAVWEIKFIGFWWQPKIDLVTLDPGRWHNLEQELRRINAALDLWEV